MKERCEFFDTCALFHSSMFLNSGLAAPTRLNFCQGCKQNCARYQVASQAGKEFVTLNLLPFMVDKARQIICENKYEKQNSPVLATI